MKRLNGKRFVTEERLIQFGRELKAAMEKNFKGETPYDGKDENQNRAHDE